jgi:DNA-directed RNA polymerase subunit RPC12/RpoP
MIEHKTCPTCGSTRVRKVRRTVTRNIRRIVTGERVWTLLTN